MCKHLGSLFQIIQKTWNIPTCSETWTPKYETKSPDIRNIPPSQKNISVPVSTSVPVSRKSRHKIPTGSEIPEIPTQNPDRFRNPGNRDFRDFFRDFRSLNSIYVLRVMSLASCVASLALCVARKILKNPQEKKIWKRQKKIPLTPPRLQKQKGVQKS